MSYLQLRQTALVQSYAMLAKRTGRLSTDLPMLSDTPDQIFTVVLSTGIEQQKQFSHPLHQCLLWICKIITPFSPLYQDSKTSKHSNLTTPVEQASKIGNVQPTHSENTKDKQKPRNKTSILTRETQKTEPSPIFTPNPDA